MMMLDKIKQKAINDNIPIIMDETLEVIEKNLLSILNQSFQDFEIVMVDDASEDNSKSIINIFQITCSKIISFSLRNADVQKSL